MEGGVGGAENQLVHNVRSSANGGIGWSPRLLQPCSNLLARLLLPRAGMQARGTPSQGHHCRTGEFDRHGLCLTLPRETNETKQLCARLTASIGLLAGTCNFRRVPRRIFAGAYFERGFAFDFFFLENSGRCPA